jgi:hypothetical protein
MNVAYEYAQLLKTRGVPLRELGIADIALERADALSAVELLQRASIPILGGDVYFRRQNGIEMAYANWHSDPQPEEDRRLFAKRSGFEAAEYIRSFPASDAVPLFVLVIRGSTDCCQSTVDRHHFSDRS